MKHKRIVSWLLALGLFLSLCYVPAAATDESTVSPSAEEENLDDEYALTENEEKDTVQEPLMLALDEESDSESENTCNHPLPDGTVYQVDKNGDGTADKVDADGDGIANEDGYKNYEDIPCGYWIFGLEYVCPKCGEPVVFGEQEKPHNYISTYLVNGEEYDYDDIPCGKYTEECTCESCGYCYTIDWEKLHKEPENAISTENDVDCGNTYTVSYTCPLCQKSVVEELEKEHNMELSSYVYVVDGENKEVNNLDDIPCEEAYTITYKCTNTCTHSACNYVCSYTYSEEVESKAHEPNDVDNIVYKDENGNVVEEDALTCNTTYTMEFYCRVCEQTISQDFTLDHEPDEDGISYAAAEVTSTEDEEIVSYEVTGEYTEDLDNIGCGTWYVEKFTCMYCGEEIVQLASYKDHQWETTENGEVCSVCGKNGDNKGEADIVWGDVSGDGMVDGDDATLILQYDAWLIGEAGLDLSVGDVSGDGMVDGDDATLILRYDAWLIDSFPAENS